jgi:hypothetical protein
VAGRIKSIEKYNYLFGIRSHDLPACSIVPQSTTLPRAPHTLYIKIYIFLKTFILYVVGFSSSESTWLPVNPNYVELNLEAQKAAEKSHYKVYKQLIELRKNPTIQRGGAHVAALSRNVLGFTRYMRLSLPLLSG